MEIHLLLHFLKSFIFYSLVFNITSIFSYQFFIKMEVSVLPLYLIKCGCTPVNVGLHLRWQDIKKYFKHPTSHPNVSKPQ